MAAYSAILFMRDSGCSVSCSLYPSYRKGLVTYISIRVTKILAYHQLYPISHAIIVDTYARILPYNSYRKAPP